VGLPPWPHDHDVACEGLWATLVPVPVPDGRAWACPLPQEEAISTLRFLIEDNHPNACTMATGGGCRLLAGLAIEAEGQYLRKSVSTRTGRRNMTPQARHSHLPVTWCPGPCVISYSTACTARSCASLDSVIA
jgi:hypothetical protein